MRYVLQRLHEPSTWRGAVLIATGILGVTLSPETVAKIVETGLCVAGLIGMVTKDKPEGQK